MKTEKLSSAEIGGNRPVSISHITIEASIRFARTYFIVKCGEILSYGLLNSVWVSEAWIKGKAHNF
jgi:hypothetical protein